MAQTVTLGCRVDSSLKNDFDMTAEELGLTPSVALTVFMRRFVDEGGFPFEVKRYVPSREEYEAHMLSTLEDMRDGNESVHDLVEA